MGTAPDNTTRPARMQGKTVIVTGAGSGLGQAAALACAAEGANIVCAGRTIGSVQATAADATNAGGSAFAHAVDISDMASTEALAAATLARFGRIDALINVAGIAGPGTALTTAKQTWDQVLSINLTGTWLMSRAVLPAMIEQKDGSIVLMSSLGGMVGVPDILAYCASKGGVNALTRQMACDYAPHNIRVNAICPGTVKTPLVMKPYNDAGARNPAEKERMMERALKRWPLGRWGQLDEIAALCVFLASGECGWMTGVITPLDGGMTAMGWQVGR